ncbi:hypothetical protein SPAB_00043 [Salmonella enterica subsp. enterica serovar Paratyphi B str. SPB7]|uniref:Uncharacterized protein n=1 Tax=Salmonella paratyphi B (strain ATCC BAA-1250 / SPB7) TaxID=1016998 RepID=A0A6C6YX50_SALPB|nr:hypothetical protein SPAB_00043 [Salmonella enterica subsp. enterica serovar Paratyphi B str. SPB7]
MSRNVFFIKNNSMFIIKSTLHLFRSYRRFSVVLSFTFWITDSKD